MLGCASSPLRLATVSCPVWRRGGEIVRRAVLRNVRRYPGNISGRRAPSCMHTRRRSSVGGGARGAAPAAVTVGADWVPRFFLRLLPSPRGGVFGCEVIASVPGRRADRGLVKIVCDVSAHIGPRQRGTSFGPPLSGSRCRRGEHGERRRGEQAREHGERSVIRLVQFLTLGVKSEEPVSCRALLFLTKKGAGVRSAYLADSG